MRKYTLAAVAAAAVLAVATAAYATVTFEPNSGTGFVGKGDVQTAFSWNNAMLQQNATSVTFRYAADSTYDVTIDFDTGNPLHTVTHHTVTQHKDQSVAGALNGLPRNGPTQFTGFNLLGYNGSPTTSGDPVPNVGDPCPNGNLGTCTVTAVTLVSNTSDLFACVGSDCRHIWP